MITAKVTFRAPFEGHSAKPNPLNKPLTPGCALLSQTHSNNHVPISDSLSFYRIWLKWDVLLLHISSVIYFSAQWSISKMSQEIMLFHLLLLKPCQHGENMFLLFANCWGHLEIYWMNGAVGKAAFIWSTSLRAKLLTLKNI